jgi:hypothetical protein
VQILFRALAVRGGASGTEHRAPELGRARSEQLSALISLIYLGAVAAQEARRFGIKGFIRKQRIHWHKHSPLWEEFQFRRGHDLRLHTVAVATHVS